MIVADVYSKFSRISRSFQAIFDIYILATANGERWLFQGQLRRPFYGGLFVGAGQKNSVVASGKTGLLQTLPKRSKTKKALV